MDRRGRPEFVAGSVVHVPTMDGTAAALPGKATFMEDVLDLLAQVSPDTARRVQIARGLVPLGE